MDYQRRTFMMKNKKPNSDPVSGIDDFRDRLGEELDNMKVGAIEKKCILELINIELKYPTHEKDFMDRYLGVIEEGGIT